MHPELLDESTVVPYLISRGLINRNDPTEIEILTGGVSNVVISVKSATKDLVLKQALAELKTKVKWVADQRRAIVEAKATEIFHKISPAHVSPLIDVDPERFVLVIERVTRGSTVWKEDLLKGVITPKIGADLGQVLAKWHVATGNETKIQEEFAEDDLFEQLRIAPFYRTLALQYESLTPGINELIQELQEKKSALVHGDFSPKNIMVSPSGHVSILDFEVAHFGNPIFDQAFLLAHLLCKSFYFEDEVKRKRIGQVAQHFISAYEREMGTVENASLFSHVAVIALARVDGTSPVNYLSREQQESLRNFTLKVIAANTHLSIEGFFTRGAQ